ISRLDSHDAAFTRCERCSRLILMSPRFRMPRTVGTRPTAVYGLIIRSLLRPWSHHGCDGSAAGDARDLPDAVVVQLDRDLVMLGAVGAAIEQRAPARPHHALVLLVGPAESRDDLVVAGAGRGRGGERLARGQAPVRRRGGHLEPAPGAPPPSDPAGHLRA